MKRVFHIVVVAVLALNVLAFTQGSDVAKVLGDVREALGGDKKLTAVTSLMANGRLTRVTSDLAMAPTDVEFAMELPDKFVRKDVVASMGGMTLSRTSGFNGSDVIEAMDTPPQMGGGAMVFRAGPGGMIGGPSQTPEQIAEARKRSLLASRQDFGRLTLGMFAASFKGYPVTFAYAGQAESPDGKADVIEVKGEEFAGKLFIDAKTHLPLMLSWMDKEPLRMSVGPGGVTANGGGRAMGGGAVTMVQGAQGGSITPEQREQLMRDLDERMKQAEANRRTVEFRVFYGDYKDVGGVKMPATIMRHIDGQPADQMVLEKIKLNPKLDPKKFETVK